MYINFVPQLFEWYSDARIIHITREPRAIITGERREGFDKGSAFRWKDQI
jgi:hypothetical protein